NQIVITLSPVIAEIGFDLSTNAINNPLYTLALPQGTATTFPLTVAAYDPAGNEVPTPAAGSQYLDTTATPFTISASVQLDPASPADTITLSSSSFTAPNSPTVTGSYTGATLGAGASISTSVSTSDPNVFVDPPVTVTN
ncbi:MAG TPA: hypothetical protein VN224_12720, partial [Xanthomonadales bacterium]|nr:hypothetical protein [Xanthomonadales bacterium]